MDCGKISIMVNNGLKTHLILKESSFIYLTNFCLQNQIAGNPLLVLMAMDVSAHLNGAIM